MFNLLWEKIRLAASSVWQSFQTHLHAARAVAKHHRIVQHERAARRATSWWQLGRQPAQTLQRCGRAAGTECAAGSNVGRQDAVRVLTLRWVWAGG